MEQKEIDEKLIEAEEALRQPDSPGKFHRYLDNQFFTIGQKTADKYLRTLKAFQRQDKPILSFLREKKGGVYLATIKKALLCFNFRELSHEDVFRGRRQPVQRMAIETTQEERELVIQNIDNIVHQLMACIQHDTGCRASEVVNLKAGQILSGEDGRTKLHLITKGNKSFDTYLSLDTSRALDVYREQVRDREYLFWERVDVASHTVYCRYWESVKRSAGLVEGYLGKVGFAKRFCTHSFRYGLAADLFRSGASVVDVQAALGHASGNTTLIYLQGTARKGLENVKRLREV